MRNEMENTMSLSSSRYERKREKGLVALTMGEKTRGKKGKRNKEGFTQAYTVEYIQETGN